MKKTLTVILSIIFFYIGVQSTFTQGEKKNPQNKKTQSKLLIKSTSSYSPAGRRDHFKDLLQGKDVKEKSAVGGFSQMSIDDIVLIGIIETKGKFTAIISGLKGFPYYIKTGDKFANGFVLSVNRAKIVLRKTKERGLPLYRAKDITKELNPEER